MSSVSFSIHVKLSSSPATDNILTGSPRRPRFSAMFLETPPALSDETTGLLVSSTRFSINWTFLSTFIPPIQSTKEALNFFSSDMKHPPSYTKRFDEWRLMKLFLHSVLYASLYAITPTPIKLSMRKPQIFQSSFG